MTSAWARTVAGATLVDLAIGPLFAWDVLAGGLARELHVAETALAPVFSVGLAAFAVGVLVGGRVADAVAPRRLALLTAALGGAGLLGSAFATSSAQLVAAFGLGLGAASGLGYATAVRTAGTVAHRRGLALALVVSAYAGGTIVLAPAAGALVTAAGPRLTLALVAAATACVVLAGAALLPGRPPASHHPRSARRLQLGRPELALWAAFGLGSAPGLVAFAAAGDVLGDPRAAAPAVLVLSAGNLGGRLVAGPASDRVGRPMALHVNVAALAAVCAALVLVGSGPARVAVLLVLGLQYGALSVLVPAALGDAVPAARFGAGYGVVFSGWGLAGLTAPVGAAALSFHTGWRAVFVACGGAALLAWSAVALLPGRRG